MNVKLYTLYIKSIALKSNAAENLGNDKLYQCIKTSFSDIINDVLNSTLHDNEEKKENLLENYTFIEYYSNLFGGIEAFLLDNITVYYKEFRVKILNEYNELSNLYNTEILCNLVNDNNKYLHKDELDLLIGFINCCLSKSFKWEHLYGKVKHKYATAYERNKKYVIAVDEATDYSVLDFYLIKSLLNPEFSSLSLCGDVMQGLNKNGITNWNDLTDILGKKPEIAELTVSYRQWPMLLDMSRQMYKDEKGVDAPYKTNNIKTQTDPKPIVFVSTDETEKVTWIANRIKDIYDRYEQQMPSVAIFVSDETEAENLLKQLKSKSLRDCLNGIKIENCTENRQAEGTNNVRIFNLQEVKGMEFEVAIFHNLDTSLLVNNEKMLRRYLYVGISRAVSHLAATFTKEKGNEHILKYFDKDVTSWQ